MKWSSRIIKLQSIYVEVGCIIGIIIFDYMQVRFGQAALYEFGVGNAVWGKLYGVTLLSFLFCLLLLFLTGLFVFVKMVAAVWKRKWKFFCTRACILVTLVVVALRIFSALSVGRYSQTLLRGLEYRLSEKADVIALREWAQASAHELVGTKPDEAKAGVWFDKRDWPESISILEPVAVCLYAVSNDVYILRIYFGGGFAFNDWGVDLISENASERFQQDVGLLRRPQTRYQWKGNFAVWHVLQDDDSH